MLATLILLYALNASNPVPTGCFVAAWILLSVEIICKSLKFILNLADKYGNNHE